VLKLELKNLVSEWLSRFVQVQHLISTILPGGNMQEMKARLKTQLIVLAVTVGAVAFVWWAGPARLTIGALSWQVDKDNLSNTTIWVDAHPDIKAHGDTVYAVWTTKVDPDNDQAYDPFYALSDNGGDTWITITQNISESQNTQSSNVSVAIDEEEKPHFVWAEREGKCDIYYSDLTSTVKITQTGEHSMQSDVAVANDKVHVVWAEFPSSIFYASKWVTETWPNAQIEDISSGLADGCSVPDIAIGGDGVVHAVWAEYYTAGGDQLIYYNRLLPTGWQTPTQILSPTYTSGLFNYPAIAVSGTHSVYVVYSRNLDPTGQGDQQVYFVKSIEGGQTWLPNEIITLTEQVLYANDNSPGDVAADIVVDDQGYIRAVWSGADVGPDQNEIIFYRYSMDGGEHWEATDEVTDDSDYTRTTPAIDVGQTTVHLVWARGSKNNCDVYYSRSWQSSGGVYLPVILKNYQ